MGQSTLESLLYSPVKRFLEDRGFVVKGEIGGCDLVALNGRDPPLVVIGELKLSFTFELVLQGVDRAALSDEVWLAARLSTHGKGRESDARFRNLCRHLGFGLLAVSDQGVVHVLLEAVSTRPRRNPKRRSRLIQEHRRRRGDPAVGGGSRVPIMTAYRQQALICAHAMQDVPLRPRDLKLVASDAPKILARNVYGWFTRVSRGLYGLTDAGRAAVGRWPRSSSG